MTGWAAGQALAAVAGVLGAFEDASPQTFLLDLSVGPWGACLWLIWGGPQGAGDDAPFRVSRSRRLQQHPPSKIHQHLIKHLINVRVGLE